MSLILTSTDTN